MKLSLQFSRFRGLTRKETVFETDGLVGPAGDLKDISGENWIWMSDDMTLWYPYHASMQDHVLKNPIDGELTACIFSEDDTLNYHDMNVDLVPGVDNMGECFMRSVCICPIGRDYVTLSGIETATHYSLIGEGAVTGYWNNNANGFVKEAGIYRLKKIPTDKHWFRIWYTSYQRNIPLQTPGHDDYNIYSCDAANNNLIMGIDGPAYGVYAPMTVKVRPGCPGYPGMYHPTTYDVRKIALDLAATGVPTTRDSPFMGPDGNRFQARRFGTGNYYSCADNLHQRPGGLTYRAMQVFDQDHTVTIIFRLDAGAGNYVLFCHGRYSWDGLIIMNGDAYYSRSASAPYVKIVQKHPWYTANDGQYHIFQLVRQNNIATIFFDAYDGTPVDVSSYGIDNVAHDRDVMLGTTPDGGSLDGEILYCRVDARALTWWELMQDRAVFWGTHKYSGFSRSDVAYLSTPEKTLYPVASNFPRINGSLLIEGSSENWSKYTEAFNSWGKVNTTINSDTRLSPIERQVTADTFRESAGAGVQKYIYSTIPDLPEGDWVYSIHLIPINRRYVYIDMWLIGGCFFDLQTCQVLGSIGTAAGRIQRTNDGYVRCSITFNNPLETTRYPEIFVSEDGADPAHLITGGAQDSYYIFGSQLEPLKFMSSYFPNLDNSQCTWRNGEFFALYTAWPLLINNEHILPDEFSGRGVLTVQFEAKALWSGSANIGNIERSLLEISSTFDNKRRIAIYVGTDGVLHAAFWDESTVLHEAYTPADPVDFSLWHTYKFYIDFANLANMAFTVDGAVPAGLAWTNKSGLGNMTVDDQAAVKVGCDYSILPIAFAEFKNVRFEPSQF